MKTTYISINFDYLKSVPVINVELIISTNITHNDPRVPPSIREVGKIAHFHVIRMLHEAGDEADLELLIFKYSKYLL